MPAGLQSKTEKQIIWGAKALILLIGFPRVKTRGY